MDTKRTVAAIATLLGVLAAVGAGLYYGAIFLVRQFEGSDETLLTIAVFSSIILLLAARMISTGARRAVLQQAEVNRHERKQATYAQALSNLRDAILVRSPQRNGAATGKQSTDADGNLLLLGSPEVISRYGDVLQEMLQPPADVEPLIEELIVAMRDDLSHGSVEFDELDTYPVFLGPPAMGERKSKGEPRPFAARKGK